MILILLAGIACFALCGYQLTRARAAAERDRRAALETVRAAAGGRVETTGTSAVSALLDRVLSTLALVHAKVWRKDSPEGIDAQLRRAGVSSRLTAEMFMAGRVALTILGLLAGLTLAHGAGRILLAISFAAAAMYVPTFLVSKAAARRSQRFPDRNRCGRKSLNAAISIAIEMASQSTRFSSRLPSSPGSRVLRSFTDQ